MEEIKFEDVKRFVEVMSNQFRPIGVIKIHIDKAEWLVAEVERLRALVKE